MGAPYGACSRDYRSLSTCPRSCDAIKRRHASQIHYSRRRRKTAKSDDHLNHAELVIITNAFLKEGRK